MSCQSGISKKLSIISILLRDFLTSFDKIDKKNGLDMAVAAVAVLVPDIFLSSGAEHRVK